MFSDDDDYLPPFANLAALSAKLGYTPEGAEANRATHLLDEASELIRDVAGKTWVGTDGELAAVPRRVRLICVAAAYRAFTNPEGLSQRTIGDSSKSFDRTKREGGEDVYLTAAEEAAVRKAAGESGGGLMTVTMVSGYDAGSLIDPWDAVTAE